MESSSKIIRQVDSEDKVFDYEPKEFPARVSSSASDFVLAQGQGKQSSDFIISKLAAEQAGIAKLNKQKVEERIEAEALEKLKSVEEKAYKEAYDLGLIEGTEKAYADTTEELTQRLAKLDELLETIEQLKSKLLAMNEAQFLKLLTMMSSKVAMKEVQLDKELVLHVINKVMENVQEDEELYLQLSQEDYKFIENLRERKDKKIDFLKRVKVESSDDIDTGGCILETNFGVINATIGQRVQKLWEEMEKKFPVVKAVDDEGAAKVRETKSRKKPKGEE